jgi:tetratricopeptide (TPR) repeat protein
MAGNSQLCPLSLLRDGVEFLLFAPEPFREGKRQRGIDVLVTELMTLQNAAMGQQNRLGALQVGAAEKDPAKHLERVHNVNQVIETVQKTLAFRLEQEEKVGKVLQTIEKQEVDRERKNRQKFQDAKGILEGFKKVNRMQFSTLTAEQNKRGIKLVERVNSLDDDFAEGDFETAGNLLYTCGAIMYYDEDIIQSRTFFDRAAQTRAADHTGELKTKSSYLRRFAFIHYFRAVIQKNWGSLSEALHEIDQSDELLRDDPDEFLTPTTKVEILSYIEGEEHRCRSEIVKLLDRMGEVEKQKSNRGESLNANQIRLRNRLLLLLGNVLFVAKDYRGALDQYEKALGFSAKDYYALASAGQCYRALGNVNKTQEMFSDCLIAIVDSEDFRHRRERITRAVIAVLAANACVACGDVIRYNSWARAAHELLEGNLDVDGLSPKFFSPSTKRLVGAVTLLGEIEAAPPSRAPIEAS